MLARRVSDTKETTLDFGLKNFELADANLLSAASGVAYAEPRGATSPVNWTVVGLKFWLIETLLTLRSSERRVAARDDLQLGAFRALTKITRSRALSSSELRYG
jgi:hypothetical protein